MRKMRFFSIIVATDKNGGIGKDNSIPWSGTEEFKEDIANFKRITTANDSNQQNIVIMGRKTFESIGKPLPNRINVVITRSTIDVITTYKNLSECLNNVYKNYKQSRVFVIGGEQLYKEAVTRYDCRYIYLTKLNSTYDCDRFFTVPNYYNLIHGKGNGKIEYITYLQENKISDEHQYLDLLSETLNNGTFKENRTGIPTYSVFGRQIRFDLTGGLLPLLTTKKVFYRGVVEELLFFIRGDHDNRKLKDKNIHIWDGNTSREYLDKYNKQHIQTDDLGVAYGVQWRSAGAKLESIDTDYRGKGVDQLAMVIDMIKTDPNSRRIILNAWNPEYLDDMALVPCHIMYQFVVNNNKLSCMMTQRSADLFLGLPFNIASTATLVHIIAKVCKLELGEIVINLGDAHIYNNHIDQVKTQLLNGLYRFPTLVIDKYLDNINDIEDLAWEDFKVNNYYSNPRIKADMVA